MGRTKNTILKGGTHGGGTSDFNFEYRHKSLPEKLHWFKAGYLARLTEVIVASGFHHQHYDWA